MTAGSSANCPSPRRCSSDSTRRAAPTRGVVPSVLRYQFEGVDERPHHGATTARDGPLRRPLDRGRRRRSAPGVGALRGRSSGTSPTSARNACRPAAGRRSSSTTRQPGSRRPHTSRPPGCGGRGDRVLGRPVARRAVVIAADSTSAFGTGPHPGRHRLRRRGKPCRATTQGPARWASAWCSLPARSTNARTRARRRAPPRAQPCRRRPRTSDSAPKWLTEGVAEYVGRRGTYRVLADAAPDLADRVRAGSGCPSALPDDAAFDVAGPMPGSPTRPPGRSRRSPRRRTRRSACARCTSAWPVAPAPRRRTVRRHVRHARRARGRGHRPLARVADGGRRAMTPVVGTRAGWA